MIARLRLWWHARAFRRHIARCFVCQMFRGVFRTSGVNLFSGCPGAAVHIARARVALGIEPPICTCPACVGSRETINKSVN